MPGSSAAPARRTSGLRADSEVFHTVPVGGVVTGAESREGEVRDLVVFETRCRQGVVHCEELLLADLLFDRRERSPGCAASERRVGFDRQMVCRNVLDAESDGLFERPAERVAPEARDAEDQIDGDVPEPLLWALCTASAACRAVWRRFISFRQSSSKDWMPIERRSMPARRTAAR